MDVKLYVGNLSYSTTGDDLRDLFAQAGTVVSATVVTHRDTGRSRGFGFVEMTSQVEAEKAISMFNNHLLDNREIVVAGVERLLMSLEGESPTSVYFDNWGRIAAVGHPEDIGKQIPNFDRRRREGNLHEAQLKVNVADPSRGQKFELAFPANQAAGDKETPKLTRNRITQAAAVAEKVAALIKIASCLERTGRKKLRTPESQALEALVETAIGTCP